MNVRPSSLSATEIVPSTCWECSALCGSLLTIEDGKVTKIAPNPEHPGSRGAFCVKGIRALHEWTYQEQRLRTPLRRVGERGSGRFAPVSWDDALACFASLPNARIGGWFHKTEIKNPPRMKKRRLDPSNSDVLFTLERHQLVTI